MATVLIVNEHALQRLSYRLLLEAQPDLLVIGSTGRRTGAPCSPHRRPTWFFWTWGFPISTVWTSAGNCGPAATYRSS